MFIKFFICFLTISTVSMGQIITFSDDTFSFGDIDNIQPVNRDIEFQNTGDKTLIVEKVKASCGCTAGSLEKKELEPMEKSKVSVSFNPKGRSGMQRKTVTFFTNDIENKTKKITFTANIVPVWEMEPRRLEFKFNADNSKYEKTDQSFFIKNTGKSSITVENISSANTNISVKIPESMEIKPGEKLETVVSIDEEYKPEYSIPTNIMVNAKINGESTSQSLRVVVSVPPKNLQP